MIQITKQNQGKVWAWIVVGIVVIIIIAAIGAHMRSARVARNLAAENAAQQQMIEDQQNQSSNADETTPSTTPAPATNTATGGNSSMHSTAPNATAAYTAALTTYANSRIEFDPTCQATPTHIVLTTGTTVMLDNRAPVARMISLNEHTYTVPAYGYWLTKLVSSNLPETLGINCDTSINVSEILLQK